MTPCRCVVVTGAGTRAFCAGAKLDGRPGQGGGEGEEFRELGRRLLDRIETFPKPVVAAIRGWCIGGGFALAQACDIRLAAEGAKFRTGDAYIGVIPSWGMSLTRLAHYIGRNHCLDLLMLGEDIGAAEAKALGLITRVLPEAGFRAPPWTRSPTVWPAARRWCSAPSRKPCARNISNPPPAPRRSKPQWARRMHGSADLAEGIAALLGTPQTELYRTLT